MGADNRNIPGETSSSPVAPRQDRIAVTSEIRFSEKTPSESPALYRNPLPARLTAKCRVSFAEPGLLSNRFSVIRAGNG
jgi:hypothetical protein